MWTWNWVQNMGGCPCCLEATGINVCNQIELGCLFNETDIRSTAPFCGCPDGAYTQEQVAQDCTVRRTRLSRRTGCSGAGPPLQSWE
jgi:hypothetical protein